jgi:predicted nucleic acid-binding protein
MTLPVFEAALEIEAAHGFSYGDSAIIAAARAPGCHRCCSKDLSHGREVKGVMIVNTLRKVLRI